MAAFEQFERGNMIRQEPRSLPADIYNAARLLLLHSGKSCVFVPIRSMQYMAVIDAEEIVFVNSHARQYVEFAWRNFKPQSREDLQQAVPYQFTFYHQTAAETLARIQPEFAKFVHQMAHRWRNKEIPETATILGFTDAEQIQN